MGEWDGSGGQGGIGMAMFFCLSLLGGFYLPGPQILPEFEGKDSQSIQMEMNFRGLILSQTERLVQGKLKLELGFEYKRKYLDNA